MKGYMQILLVVVAVIIIAVIVNNATKKPAVRFVDTSSDSNTGSQEVQQ